MGQNQVKPKAATSLLTVLDQFSGCFFCPNLGLIIFTVLIKKSEKQWKVLRDCLKNLRTGVPLGYQTLPWGCAPRESLMTLGKSLRQIFPDNPYRLSTVCTRPSQVSSTICTDHYHQYYLIFSGFPPNSTLYMCQCQISQKIHVIYM